MELAFKNYSPEQKQFAVARIASIGGYITGTSFGWMTLAVPMMKDDHYAFRMTGENLSWIFSLMPLGALLGCLIMAFLVDKFGRKTLMIFMGVPTSFGWTLIICAQSVSWIYAGRILLGFASGSFSIIVPLYTTEIAEKERRGALGSYFQLHVVIGFLLPFFLGIYFKLLIISLTCAIVPLVVLLSMFCIPESPYYYLMKKNSEKARMSLMFFLESDDKVNRELVDIKKFLNENDRKKMSMMDAFLTTAAKRALLLGFGSMVFQQFSGCNAVILYSTCILKETGSFIGSSYSKYTIGAVGCLSTYLSGAAVDTLGRKCLLFVSVVVMGLCTFLIGGFMYGKHMNYDVSSFIFAPYVLVCVYVFAFSIGFGPIPWMMMGEIFPARIKGVACSIVTMSNWLFVFLIIKFFTSIVFAIHTYTSFWVFTLFNVVGTFYVLFIVPETKCKTMEEIQVILSGTEPSLPG